MVQIIGKTDRGILHTPLPTTKSKGNLHFTLTEFAPTSSQKVDTKFDLSSSHLGQTRGIKVTHASLQPCITGTLNDEQSSKHSTTSPQPLLFLIALVYTIPPTSANSASILLVRSSQNKESSLEVLAQVDILSGKDTPVSLHFLPNCAQNGNAPDKEMDTGIAQDEEEECSSSFTSQLLVLVLGENITLYDVESSPPTTTTTTTHSAKLNILSSLKVVKNFWWAQFLPQQEAIAFAHFRQPRISSFDDEIDASSQPPKPFLSILQFHKNFPRESVLNMPLPDAYANRTVSPSLSVSLLYDPTILSSSPNQLKLLPHPSGAVYLFHLCSSNNKSDSSLPQELNYCVNMLHHNKTVDVHLKLSTNHSSHPQIVGLDVALYSKDQYLVVAGWPFFIHFLDIGSTHEPSHHLILEWDMLPLPIGMSSSSSPFLCLANFLNPTQNEKSTLLGEKTDLSPKHLITTSIIFNDLTHFSVELTSALLLPLMQTWMKNNNQFKLAILHHFLVHVGDINVSKRIIYDEGKKLGNLFLTQLYQEFLIGHAHLQTKKQILPTMDSFVYLLPYSADPVGNGDIHNPTLQISTQSFQVDVSIMLLSPSQRIFPHNVTDTWTSLWHLNRLFSKSKRFNHKHIAEKLLLSLQCYKPEALSRASTPGPMSPSSPMICTSLGDIVGMFGRRATELQLPFVEHESCTANKQEYIFSINLREMSMHLLKERKEWPLHGHTVAGKYVCALGDSARLLCHLLCLTANLQPTKNRDKGFPLIDTLPWDIRLKLFMLMEHYTLALGTLACPLPQGFTPFFAYLGYRVLNFDQFLWHVKSGTFDLQIDLVKTIMADIKEDKEENVSRKLHLLSLLPKTRANRILNAWSHKMSLCLRARQHASDLLSGSVSQNRKRIMTAVGEKKKKGATDNVSIASSEKMNPLDTFFQLLTAKANPSEIDLGLLAEATLISME